MAMLTSSAAPTPTSRPPPIPPPQSTIDIVSVAKTVTPSSESAFGKPAVPTSVLIASLLLI